MWTTAMSCELICHSSIPPGMSNMALVRRLLFTQTARVRTFNRF